MLSSDPNPVEAAQPSPDAEAARYALLRRLAPSMRHHLVVNLQPIGMIYEVMERRLRAPQPDLAHVHESASKINTFARAALASSLDVVGWLAPDEKVGVGVHDAARECSSLLATSLSFRGYALRNEVGPIARQVRRSTIRSLLAATLIHTADHLKPPSDIVLAAGEEEGGVLITVTSRQSDGDKGFSNEAPYRKIEWRDLQALGVAEGVQVLREGALITLRMPWVAG
jgi:hypothetical protein